MIGGLHNKVGNIHQIGGIETSVLDNGPAKGSRIAWVNTGSGLRYKVAIDRGLDIVDAFYNQHSLTWLSHGGLTAPNPAANSGIEWLYSFSGGLVTTCGLTHIGSPESDDTEIRGLHGRISNIPATLESVIQPDPATGKMNMSITALAKESKVFGPHLTLRRTISSMLGESTIMIRDEVTNCGNTPCPHMILYHCNFGWPLVDEGGNIVYKGTCESRGMDFDNELFNEKQDYKKCQKPLESHKGFGESCGFIDVQPDSDGFCHVGLVNSRLSFALVMTYQKQQLPALTNWQHWGPSEYVCAMEPGTNPPIGQNKAREENTLVMLKPGQRRTYQLDIQVLSDSQSIQDFVSKTQ
ncbi:MAG: aldose 1-epimerase family protein [Planctomycetes bacterium]|nr:aldose 1-epimerase family protein [Planctomycetota bacterium]